MPDPILSSIAIVPSAATTAAGSDVAQPRLSSLSPAISPRRDVYVDMQTQTPTRLHTQFRRFTQSQKQDAMQQHCQRNQQILPALSTSALSSPTSPIASSRTWAPRTHRPLLLPHGAHHSHTMRRPTTDSTATELHEYLNYLRDLRSADKASSASQGSSRIVANFQSLSQELSLVLQQKELLIQAQQSVRQHTGGQQLTLAELDQQEASVIGLKDNSHLAVKAREVETDVHRIPLTQLEHSLQTDLKAGLSPDEVAKRQQTIGINLLTPPPSPSMLYLLVREFFSGFGPILWVAALLCFLAWRPFGDPPDPVNLGLALIIIAVIVLSSSFAFYQTRKSISIITAFSRILPSFAVVRRGGREQQVLATDLVPGDIVFIKLGDKVPADVRLLTCDGLQVNNSALTGESEPVECGLESDSTNFLEARNLAFYSSLVVQGAASGVVVNTGDRTVLGHVSALTKTDAGQLTNLQREIRRFVIIICTLAITTAIICLIAWLSWLRIDHYTFLPTSSFLTNVIGLVVAYLPTGLPLSLSLVLTFVAKRMYKQRILVKNLSIVEDFNSVSLICTDKTGTLTLNQLTATNALWGREGHITIPLSINDGDPFLQSSDFTHAAFQQLLLASVLCNNADIRCSDGMGVVADEVEVQGDAVDVALYELGRKCRLDMEVERGKHKRVKVQPFNSKSKLMISINVLDGSDETQLLAMCKGAPEFVLQRCTRWLDDSGAETAMTETEKAAVTARQEQMGANGYRVIAVCQQRLTCTTDTLTDLQFPTTDCTFVGLLSFIDPPRPGVPASVAKSHGAGIRVAMVTGDHPTTAVAIAKQVNIVQAGMRMDRCTVKRDEWGWTVQITRDGQLVHTHTIGGLDGSARDSNPTNHTPTNQSLRSLFDVIPNQPPTAVALYGLPPSPSPVADGLSAALPSSSLSADTIASECGILVTGSDMKSFDVALWDFVLRHSSMVFARTSPEQKLKIVSECQKRGEVVAVTGDGTNDAVSKHHQTRTILTIASLFEYREYSPSLPLSCCPLCALLACTETCRRGCSDGGGCRSGTGGERHDTTGQQLRIGSDGHRDGSTGVGQPQEGHTVPAASW